MTTEADCLGTSKTTERKFVADIVATEKTAAFGSFAIPCPMPQLLWWFAVQGVYARSIGSSFACPANDNALRGAL